MMQTFGDTKECGCWEDCPRKEQFIRNARDEIPEEEIEKFYQFLQGELPPDLHMRRHPHLSSRMAFRIIYYLQEEMGLLPDKYERCVTCGELYDSEREGSSKGGMHCDYHRKD